MVTIYSLLIVEWGVEKHPPREVRFVKSTPYSACLTEGLVMHDAQAIVKYIREQPDDKEQQRLFDLTGQGLLTVVQIGQVKVPIPSVSPP